MATRSEIAIQEADGTIKSIYCHSDGYIKYVGVMLKKYYNNFNKASSIINQNDCSVLKPTIEIVRIKNNIKINVSVKEVAKTLSRLSKIFFNSISKFCFNL